MKGKTMKIELADDILALVITSRDQVKPGMRLWHVGQGGVTDICKPSYQGEVIGFGWSEYTGTDVERGRCVTFKIEDNDPEFVVVATDLGSSKHKDDPEPTSIISPIKTVLEFGEYRLHDIRSPNYYGELYVVNRSFLPQPYNNWYMCDSLEKAQKVYEAMTVAWAPEHEASRKDYERRMDDYDAFDKYYEFGEYD